MRKVLIITYYWPPAGGPGVQRWLKFVKYLREFDIEPVVYIPENPHYGITDPSLIREIPEGITIISQRIREPYRWASWVSKKKTKRISSGVIHSKDQSLLEKVMLWVRGNWFIPDARKSWVRPSVDYLSEYLSKEQIKTIITTGPPHSLHLIGMKLKELLELTWIADFRDPWTSIGYHSQLKLSRASREKHKSLESQVLTRADKIIVTSQTTREEFKAITDRPISVITNGYDRTSEGMQELDEKFTISHIGSLLSGRNPDGLWKVLSELSNEHEDFRKAFQLQIIGVVSEDVLAGIERHGLKANTRVLGYVDHEKAMEYQNRSQVLLLVEIDSEKTRGIIPGKLFEYLAARRPIVALGPTGWEAGTIVVRSNAGVAFGYGAGAQIKEVILSYFLLYKEGGLSVSSQYIEQYSRKALTGKLAELLTWE